MKLSVIIASNRPDYIKKCLLSLLNANDRGEAELIVINNAPKQKSDLYTKGMFRVIWSEKNNLSNARNIGWQKAKGEYIAYIDDDAIADKNWIKNILKFIHRHPNIQAFGGPYNRFTNFKTPVWVSGNYSTSNYGNRTKKLQIGYEWLSGTNMVFKKTLLKELGGFNEKLGMKGNKTDYGEETDLQVRIAQRGIDIWYEPSILVSHLLTQSKTGILWMLYDAYRRGRTFYRIKNKYPQFFTFKINVKAAFNPYSNLVQIVINGLQNTAYAAGLIMGKLKS